MEADDDGLLMDEDEAEDEMGGEVKIFRPGIDKLAPGEVLDFDPTAYVMYHQLRSEWPSLSFDFIKDDLGGNRTRFPLTMYAVAGSQAADPAANKLTVMKMSDMHRMARVRDDDGPDSEAVLDLEGGDDAEEEDCDEDPTLEVAEVAHPGAGVNRVRSCPHNPGLVAAWGDDAKVRLFDVTPQLAALASGGPKPALGSTGPCFTFAGHKEEGYALDWSRVSAGVLATGDCAGRIHVWQPAEGGSGGGGGGGAGGWAVEPTGRSDHTGSVEDLQWSPSEATVFISCSTDRSIKVSCTYDPVLPCMNQMRFIQIIHALNHMRLSRMHGSPDKILHFTSS